MPTFATAPAVPAFRPITITLNTLEEAQAFKVLMTDTAKDAVSRKSRLAVNRSVLDRVADSTFRHLKAQGVKYLLPR